MTDRSHADGGDRDGTGGQRDRPVLDGARGWLVVGLVAGGLVGAPVAILLWPPTFLPVQDAYLALSLVPGLALGALGVWLALVRGQ